MIMMIKGKIFVAVASIMLATSCSQDVENGGAISNCPIELHSSVGKAESRAVETTTANLTSFKISAFQSEQDNWMSDILYTGSGSNWSTDAGQFFWPMSGDLNFYCYAPAAPGKEGSFVINSSSQKLNGFVPNATAATQQDFVYAKATGSLAKNGTSGLDVNFQHALTEVSVKAKNDNSAYSVEVSGVQISNVVSKGDFTFPSVTGSQASWSPWNVKATYTTEWTSANKLSSTISSLDAANVPFMLIPQQLSGEQLALKVKITMQGGDVIYDDWTHVYLNAKWEMGKHYTYTLDFSNGAGYNTANKLIFGGEIAVDCSISNWQTINGIKVVNPIPRGEANCYILSDNSVVTINPYIRANYFWTSAEGDVKNAIVDNTEWTAEVIWQDINSRAINFCDASGNVVSGDSLNGKGLQPLYIKAVGGQKGNVLVGVKKKGAGSDAYLWSWHLWLTDEPKLVSGFMDRNLGAISASPTGKNKAYGLYYQYGRKDPFVGNVDIYGINGQKIQTGITQKGNTIREYATYGKSINNPNVFYYNEANKSKGDWLWQNNYTSQKWNDISNAAGKTFFDPCPEGWILPTIDAFSDCSVTTFLWNFSLMNGATYKGNWFPAAGGYFVSLQSYPYNKGSVGEYWISSNRETSNNLMQITKYTNSRVLFLKETDTFGGNSIRCVKE